MNYLITGASGFVGGHNTKIRNTTGWFPKIPFEITVSDLYEYWMSKI